MIVYALPDDPQGIAKINRLIKLGTHPSRLFIYTIMPEEHLGLLREFPRMQVNRRAERELPE